MAHASCTYDLHDSEGFYAWVELDPIFNTAATQIQLHADHYHLYLTLSDAQLETLYGQIVARRSEIAQRQLQESEGVAS